MGIKRLQFTFNHKLKEHVREGFNHGIDIYTYIIRNTQELGHAYMGQVRV